MLKRQGLKADTVHIQRMILALVHQETRLTAVFETLVPSQSLRGMWPKQMAFTVLVSFFQANFQAKLTILLSDLAMFRMVSPNTMDISSELSPSLNSRLTISGKGGGF